MKKSMFLVLVCAWFGQSMASDAATEALWIAIYHKDIRAAEDALIAGANVNAVNNFDETPLIVATYMNKNKIAKRLIEVGADVNAQDCMGVPALSSAVCDENYDLARLLLKAGAQLFQGFSRKKIDFLDRVICGINAERQKNAEALVAQTEALKAALGADSVFPIFSRTLSALDTEKLELASKVYENNGWIIRP